MGASVIALAARLGRLALIAVCGFAPLGVATDALALAKLRCPKGARLEVRRQGGRARVERCVRRVDGLAHGPYRRLKRSGAVAETGTYTDGERSGPWMHRFLLSSDSGHYVAGQKDGRWMTKLDTGERHELHYRLGVLHGDLSKIDAKGKVLDHERYTAGEPDGAFWGLWSDGRQRLKGRYERGKRVGVWRWWYDDGSIERELTYVDGREHGPARQNWPGGALWEQGSYNAGERDGPWSAALPDGTLLYRGTWRAGEQVGAWSWPADSDAAAGGAVPPTAAPPPSKTPN